MTGVETRSVSRDSLFLLASIRVEQGDDTHRVRVRNLSDGGMMGEGSMRVKRGNRLQIELRNIGQVAGTVAWVQDNRFGIAFDEEIDSQGARASTAGQGRTDDSAMIERSWQHRAPKVATAQDMRKV
ncbi:MAG: PilZ domain-containing protein [Pseudomonadota bacterium]